MSIDPEPKKNNRVLIALLAVIGALLLALVALVFFILGQGSTIDQNPTGPGSSASPSAAPGETPSETPTASPSGQAAPPAGDTTTRFTSFNAPTTVTCDAGDENSQPPKPTLMVSWASANAVEAWYSPGNQDAKDKSYMQVPLSGNQNDFTDEHLFPCFDQGPSRDYTITLVGPNGEHVSKTWTVTDLSR